MPDLRDTQWLRWLSEVDPFSAGYLSCDSDYHPVRLGHALRDFWVSMPVNIEPGDLLVGRTQGRGIGSFSFGGGVQCDAAEAERQKEQSPQWREHLDELVSFWNGWNPSSRVKLPDDEPLMNGQSVYWAGWGGHAILGFERLLTGGLEGIRDHIRSFQQAEEDPEKRAYREALLVVCDGIEGFARNYATAAAQMAEAEPDESRRGQLEEISARCSRVPQNGARSFDEALQSFWFIHLLDGCDSPGRFDQYMHPYYRRCVEGGSLTPEAAQDWLDHLWKRFNDHRSWNVCVGGLLPDGRDGTNELTHMALEATRRIRKIAPNLSLRLHSGSPDSLWQEAVVAMATGCGMPALYNDEVMVPALMRYGIPEEEARDYALNGCSQVDLQGKSHMGLEDGEMTLLKCLELALHDGLDPRTQEQIGPHSGDPRDFDTFEQLWQAYTAQVEYFSKRLTDAANAVQQGHGETSPNLLRSLFVDDCIESGRDFKAGGPRHNHGQILTQGIANTADALVTVQKFVFEERSVSMDELLEAMEKDFPDESFRQRLIQGAPKFGNDDKVVDEMAARVIDHFYRHLNTYRTWRGGTYGGGSIVFTRAVSAGAKVGATPDGRRAFTPLADSVGPSQGRDLSGPTAMFNSVAQVPQRLAQCAYVLNAKFGPSVFLQSADKVVDLFKTYFRQGGQQLQVNVVDRETLLKAREQPEEYRNLIVRVGGFSDYFVRLSPELQADVIARTEHVL